MVVFAFTLTIAHATLIALAVPSILGSYLIYKRGRAQDLAAAQAGVVTTQTVTTGQVLDSLDRLVQRLTADNDSLRDELEKANEKLDRQLALIESLRAEVAALRFNNGKGGM